MQEYFNNVGLLVSKWHCATVAKKKCRQVPVGTNDGSAVGFSVGVWDGCDVGLAVATRVGLAEGTNEGFPKKMFTTKIVRMKGSICNCASFGLE